MDVCADAPDLALEAFVPLRVAVAADSFVFDTECTVITRKLTPRKERLWLPSSSGPL
jgi:hypothetical protein